MCVYAQQFHVVPFQLRFGTLVCLAEDDNIQDVPTVVEGNYPLPVQKYFPSLIISSILRRAGE